MRGRTKKGFNFKEKRNEKKNKINNEQAMRKGTCTEKEMYVKDE